MDHTHENGRPRTNFHMIPERLIDEPGISCEAAMALMYMCTRPIGYITRTSEIQSALNIGPWVWRRVYKELRKAGAITLQWRRNRHTGRLVGRSHIWDWGPWLGPAETLETNASAQHVDKSTDTSVSHASENQRMGRMKSTRHASETNALNHTRKKEGAGSDADASPPAPERNAAPGRRDATHSVGAADLGEEDRVIPSLERRRELARELLGADAAEHFPGLFDADRADHA